jgi:ribosomal protein S27E
MKNKVLFITAILLASLFFLAIEPVSAAPDYDQTKYDPRSDVMRVRTGGDFKFASHSNVEINKMTSEFIDEIIDKVKVTMTVEGTITDDLDYKYAFIINSDSETYIFGYRDKTVIGFELGTDDVLLATAEKEDQDKTLAITFTLDSINNPSNTFDFTAAALYSVGDYERYVDLAPDKLIIFTEPSDGSTVYGDLPIKGVIRESVENQPGNTISLSIDGTDLPVSGTSSWSATLDTTTLSEGDHTLRVEVDGTEYSDQITIKVDQNTNSYESFNQEPEIHVGDKYHYELMGDASVSGVDLSLSNEMDTEVQALETLDGTEVFKVWTHTFGEHGFGSLQDYTVAQTEVTGGDKTTTETTTTYSTPLETHNGFSVKVGFQENTWPFSTVADSTSQTSTPGEEPQTNPPYSEQLNIKGECLYYLSSINIFGNNFDDIYLIRTYYENPGASIVEYYSPEMGVPVRIDTFDPSRNLLFSLGLESWEQVPFSIEILDDVSFSPSKPKADSKNQITVRIRNVGDETASNIDIVVKDGAQQIADENIASISSGGTEDITVDWTPSSEGNHTLTITATTDNIDLADRTVYVDVVPGGGDDDGDDMFMVLSIIGIIAAVAVVLVVVLMARKKKKAEGEIPAETAGAEVEAAPVAAAPAEQPGVVVVATDEPQAQPAAPLAAQATPAVTQEPTPKLFMENIQCPSCQNSFTVKFESKPIRVKCPTCGTEGVLN